MKPTLFPVLLAAILPNFLACSKKDTAGAGGEISAPPEMSIPHAPLDSRWEATEGLVRHLEFGGTSFAYESHAATNSTIKLMLEIADKLIDAGSTPGEGVRLSPAWKKLGWSRVVGSGSSRRKLGKMWHHRGILFAPKDKPAFFPVFGTEAQPWQAPSMVPEDSDLVLEFSVDVPYAMEMVGELAAELGPKPSREYQDARKRLREDKVVGPMIDSSKGRVCLFIFLDPDKPMELPAEIGKFPTIRGGIVISSPEFSAFTEKLAREDGDEKFEVRADGTLLVNTPKDENAAHAFPLPTVVINPKAGLTILTDSPETLAALESKDATLSESKEFARAARNLSAEGNAMMYVSSRLQKELGELAIRYGRELAKGPDAESGQMATFLQDFVAKAALSQAEPQMAVLKADADGWVWGANLSFERMPLNLPMLYTMSMGTIGFRAFEKARDTANLTQAIQAGKTLHLASLSYAADHADRFPASLGELVPAYLPDLNQIAVRSLDLPVEKQWEVLTAGRSASDAGGIPIFVLAEEINGKHAVVFISGAVQAMTPDEVRAVMQLHPGPDRGE